MHGLLWAVECPGRQLMLLVVMQITSVVKGVCVVSFERTIIGKFKCKREHMFGLFENRWGCWRMTAGSAMLVLERRITCRRVRYHPHLVWMKDLLRMQPKALRFSFTQRDPSSVMVRAWDGLNVGAVCLWKMCKDTLDNGIDGKFVWCWSWKQVHSMGRGGQSVDVWRTIEEDADMGQRDVGAGRWDKWDSPEWGGYELWVAWKRNSWMMLRANSVGEMGDRVWLVIPNMREDWAAYYIEVCGFSRKKTVLNGAVHGWTKYGAKRS